MLTRVVCGIVFSVIVAEAVTVYVDPDGSGGDGLSWESAKATIQEAIDIAPAGATVLVAKGVYDSGSVVGIGDLKCRVRIDNNIVVKSVEPHGAVIRGSGVQYHGDLESAIRCVEIVSGTLEGFIVEEGTTGSLSFHDNSLGGGIFSHNASTAVVKNCIVRNCKAGGGGGTFRGVLYDCTLTNNVATGNDGGGAMHNGKGYRCLVAHNQTLDGSGGGIYGHPNGVYEDCIIRDNSAVWSAGANLSFGGGGVFYGNLTRCVVSNNMVTGFTSGGGGGTCRSTLTDSIVAHNYAESANGGGVSKGTLTRCIISENTVNYGSGGGSHDATLYQCNVISNNLISYHNGNAGGIVNGSAQDTLIAYNRSHSVGGVFSAHLYNCTVVGNVSVSENAAGIHLSTGKRVYNCLVFGNTGSPEKPSMLDCDIGNLAAAEVDIRGTLAGTSDIVIDGLTLIPVEVPVFADYDNGDFRLVAGSPAVDAGDMGVALGSVDLAGNGRVIFGAVDAGAYEYCNLFVATDGDDASDGLTLVTAKRTIQAAVDSAEDGMEILVASGVYDTGSAATPDGTLLNRVAITKDVKVRSLAGPEQTIIQGSGIGGYDTDDAMRGVFMSSGTLDGFTVEGGATKTGGWREYQRGGGGICIESPAAGTCVTNCIIRNNRGFTGGGITGGDFSRGTARVVDCIITNNFAHFGGGGAYGAIFECCLVKDNTAINEGGGFYEPHTVYNSVIVNNSASRYGGVYSSGYMVSCTIAHNSGGGIRGVMHNGNELTLYAKNCIVWGNSGEQYGSYCNFESSCSYPGGSGITVEEDPRFLDVVVGDFRLKPGSPCIDMGAVEHVVGRADQAGSSRVVSGMIDIGGLESPQYLAVIFDASPGVFEESGESQKTVLIPYRSQGYGSYVPEDVVKLRGFKPTGWYSQPERESELIGAESLFVSPYPHTIYQHWQQRGLTMIIL